MENIEADVAETVNSVNKAVAWIMSRLPVLLHTLIMLAIAVALYFVGRKLIKVLIKIINKSLEKSSIDTGVVKFLNSLVDIVLTIILIVVLAGFIGFETTSLAAVVGSAGLAIGLSLQGSLANLAGGVLILVLKPFTIGDYIIAGGHEGTVSGIDIFYTRLKTADNKSVVIPNGQLSNGSITNVTKEEFRRVDLIIGIDYSQDIRDVRKVLADIAERNELVENEKEIDIYVDELADSSVNMGFRIWTKTENYWKVKCDILEKIKEEFDKNGISIPYNQLDESVKREG